MKDITFGCRVKIVNDDFYMNAQGIVIQSQSFGSNSNKECYETQYFVQLFLDEVEDKKQITHWFKKECIEVL